MQSGRRLTPESQALAPALFEAIPHPAVVVDRTGRILKTNEAFRRTVTRSLGPTEAGRLILSQFLEREDYRAWGVALTKCISRRESQWLEATLRAAVPRRIELRLAWCATDAREGVVVVALTDVTTRHEELNRLKASEESFRTMIDESTEAKIIHLGGRVRYVNPAARHLLSVRGGSEIQSLAAYFDPDERSDSEARWRHVLKTRTPVRTVGLSLDAGGDRHRIVDVVDQAVHFDGALHVATTLTDVTEELAQRAKRIEDDRLASVGSLAAGLAHQINNPLGYIFSNLDYIREQLAELAADPAGLGEVHQALDDMQHGAGRIRDMVRQLSAFTKANDAHAAVDMHQLLEVAQRLSHNELAYRATLYVDVKPETWVMGNEGRLLQVFVNLLRHAAASFEHADPSKNVVRLEVEVQRQTVLVRVSDNGTALDGDVLSRVFDPFSTKGMPRGTGLDLTVAHSIVRQHGGEIRVFSRADDDTTVEVTLPLFSSPAAAVDRDRATRDSSPVKRPRVLLVDDEPLVLNSLRRILRNHCEVVTARSGNAALELIRQAEAPFDVVITDVMMTDGTGLDLYRTLEAENHPSAARMYFLTGGAFSRDEEAFLAQRPDRCLRKPVHFRELLSVIEAEGKAPCESASPPSHGVSA